MDRQARTGETVLVISRDMKGRTQTLSWVAGGRMGKDDRKKKYIGPVVLYCSFISGGYKEMSSILADQ